MKEFFKEIFEYHHYVNNLLIEQVAFHEKALPRRTHRMLCHILNAGRIWNARILSVAAPGLNDVYTFGECLQIQEGNFNDALNILEKYNLNQAIYYKNATGNEFTNTISDILFHSSNHATHHKGQIIADFRSSGIEPLITDYIFYKRKT